MGGRQSALKLPVNGAAVSRSVGDLLRQRPAPLPSRIRSDEAEAHLNFVTSLGKAPIWARYLSDD
jgi:DNA polymerase-3 subunit epsilon